jgi:hypothetical protein
MAVVLKVLPVLPEKSQIRGINMHIIQKVCLMFILIIISASTALAQAPPVQNPSSKEDIQNALTGGVPMGRWKEGLLFEGVRPMPWLKSAANWFPWHRGSTA